MSSSTTIPGSGEGSNAEPIIPDTELESGAPLATEVQEPEQVTQPEETTEGQQPTRAEGQETVREDGR
jgi:hypothetical protein